MKQQESVNELLLNSWIRLTTAISNERIVSDMPYNEAIICNILYRNHRQGGKRLTATDLCQETKMLKSLMNRTLNSMEEKNIIHRERSTTDKRNVYIELNEDKIDIYLTQHSKILKLIDTLIDKYGKENGMKVYQLFEEISEIAEEVLK